MIDNESEAIQQLLQDDGPLSTAIGTYTEKVGAGTQAISKIFVNTVPSTVLEADTPFIRIKELSGIDNPTKDGRGIKTAIMGVDIYAQRNKEASDIHNLIYTVLHDYTGTQGSIVVQEMWYETRDMDHDPNLEKQMLNCEYRARVEV